MNPKPAAVRMADRAGERIGGVGRGIARQGEQALDHVLHLLFRSVAVADDRLLHLERGVFRHRKARQHRGADRRAARLAERQRGLRIGIDEHLLHRDLSGRVRRDDFLESFEDALQPRREVSGAGFDAAARDIEEAGILGLDHPESRDLQTRIDPEDPQSTTAVVYTPCTSSRLSSASSSRRMRAASSPASGFSIVGFIVISASSGLRPACASAAFTAAKSAGAQTGSTESSSFFNTSTAPASRAASITLSSLVTGANTNWPQCLKRYATEPSEPRLPPFLLKAWRTSATVRVRLSVRHSTSTAAPATP